MQNKESFSSVRLHNHRHLTFISFYLAIAIIKDFELTEFPIISTSQAFSPQTSTPRHLAKLPTGSQRRGERFSNSNPGLSLINGRNGRLAQSEAVSVEKGKNLYQLGRKKTSTTIQEQPQSDSETSSGKNASSSSLAILPIALVSLTVVTVAALAGYLPGPPIDASAPQPAFLTTIPFGSFLGAYDTYALPLVQRDLLSALFSIVAAAAFVKGCTYPVTRGWIEPRDSRKIIHTFSAPLFLFVWPLFSHAYGARVFAAVVPLLNAVRLFVAGTGGDTGNGDAETKNSLTSAGTESELARAISRSGDAREALQGPFVYVIVLLVSTLFFWTDTPIGVVAIATMAAGDGLADLFGRRFGATNKWFFNQNKSIAGSTAFVAGSFIVSYGLLSWLMTAGTMDPIGLDAMTLSLKLMTIAIVCAAVELIPAGDDNWSVPISAAILAAYMLN